MRPEPLASERDALLFLVLGGPLACLVSATVGIAGLHFFGGMPPEGLVLTWITWWVGDTLGVLLFAPLTLLVLPESGRHWRGHALQVAGPLLIVGARHAARQAAPGAERAMSALRRDQAAPA